jgi:prepilin-type N-terminal cleavage/methylation domain-containing protein
MRGANINAGFTMVELLVVVAMITIFAGLLFPVLNKGKRNAQAAYDLNNTRQIIVAAQMYAGENDDYLPQPGWGTKAACWAAGANVPDGHAATIELYTNALVRQLVSFQKGQLYLWLKNDRLLRCPADNVINDQFLKRNIYISSYVWNVAIIGYPDNSSTSAPTQTFKLRQFQPDAIMQWEADERRAFGFNDFSAYPDEGISVRHNNGSTVGRFDGGAERMILREYEAHAGPIAADFDHSGVGWKRSQTPTPNRAWCSPAHRGVPDAAPDDTVF